MRLSNFSSRFVMLSMFVFFIGCSTSAPQPNPNPLVPDYFEFKNYSLVAVYGNNGWNVQPQNNGSVKIDLNTVPDPVTIAIVCEKTDVSTIISRYTRSELKQLKALLGVKFVSECNAATQPISKKTTIVFNVSSLTGQQKAQLAQPYDAGIFNVTTTQRNQMLVEDSTHLGTMLYFNGLTDTIPSAFERKSFVAKANSTVDFDFAKSRSFLSHTVNITPAPSAQETGYFSESTTMQGAGSTYLVPSSKSVTGLVTISIFPVDALEANELHSLQWYFVQTDQVTKKSSSRSVNYYFRSPTLTNLDIPNCTSTPAERTSGLAYASSAPEISSDYISSNFSGVQSGSGKTTKILVVTSSTGDIGKLPVIQLTELSTWNTQWNFDSSPISVSSSISGHTANSYSNLLSINDGALTWSCSHGEILK